MLKGLFIMVVGIGTVFLFLALLIYATRLSSFLLALYAEKKVLEPSSPKPQPQDKE